MADEFDRLNRRGALPPRPREVVEAEQQRHDRAWARGLTAMFTVLIVGGGLGAFIALGPWFRGNSTVQAVLVALVFLLPFVAALVYMARVPPPPSESLTDPERAIDARERARRTAQLSLAFNAGMLALQSFWISPLLARHPVVWPFNVLGASLTLLIIVMGVGALYARPGGPSPQLRALDDEVTASFRARAQSLGYLLLLAVLAVLAVLARINPALAVRVLPLGVGLGVILPVLYFVYLDWRASRPLCAKRIEGEMP